MPDAAGTGLDGVQLRYECHLSGEEYVKQQAWRSASLERCPLHPAGSCGLARHGTYERKEPWGMRVARWYCPQAQVTFSLLPDFAASRLSGSLQQVEAVVHQVEQAPSVEAAAEVLRPEIGLVGAVRWVRRRLAAVRTLLALLRGLSPELFAHGAATLATLRQVLGEAQVLPALRHHAAPHLRRLPPPLGFGPRPNPRSPPGLSFPHKSGPESHLESG